MMNGHDYRRDRSDRDYYDEPHYRSWGGAHEEPRYHGYGRSYYDLSHRGCGHGGYYDEPYSDYDYGHYEYGDRSREPYYWRGHEGGYRAPLTTEAPETKRVRAGRWSNAMNEFRPVSYEDGYLPIEDHGLIGDGSTANAVDETAGQVIAHHRIPLYSTRP